MRRLRPLIFFACLLFAAPAALAQGPHQLDLPGGRLGDAVVALGRQAGVSIGITDPALAARRVAPVRGRYTVNQALALLLRDSDGRYLQYDRTTFRIVRRPTPRPRWAQRAPTPAVAGHPVQQDHGEPLVGEGEDLVVTGARLPVTLASYPGSAEIVRDDDPALAGVPGSEALVARLPEVSSTHLGPGRNKLFIRGLADSSFNGPTQATVGQYLGETRVNYNAPDPDLRLYDIDRIEVLQGPQGTLYGAGSLGGIIRVLPNAPRVEGFEGSASLGASATLHGEPGADAAATLNLPLIPDRLALRVTGYGVTEGGYIDDTLRRVDDVNRVTAVGSRLGLRLVSPDEWTIDVSATGQRISGDDGQFADRDAPPLTRRSAIEQPFRSDYMLADLVVSKEWGDTRFVTALGYVNQRLFERYDATRFGMEAQLFEQDTRVTLLSAESRLSGGVSPGLAWLIGASVISNDAEQRRFAGPVDAPVAMPGVSNRILEAAGFGQLSVTPIADLAVTAGGRLTHSSLSGESLGVELRVLQPLFGPQASRNETAFLPSLSVAWTPRSDLVLFARYEESFRPGGLSVAGDFIRRFRNDTVSAWEAGIRYGGRGAPVSAALSLAYTNWDDIQADTIGLDGFPTTANIGNGHIVTLDFRLGWRPLPGLNLEIAAVANDSEVTNPNPNIDITTNAPLPNVADLSARVGADYRTAIGTGTELVLTSTARYVGHSRLGIGPILGVEQGGWLDIGLGARIERGGQAFSLTVTNLLDQAGNRFAFGSPFTLVENPQVTPMRPLTVRLGWQTAF
ncbi:MAG: TonB-dependent receptor domain-containing protein [Allosphingosinicella sp.]|uniref:TonB-dependent receptor domain-containing protein n=1 Tax=Allosphingosinicella sp. TaxID=2823234 RepID=UPI0039551884